MTWACLKHYLERVRTEEEDMEPTSLMMPRNKVDPYRPAQDSLRRMGAGRHLDSANHATDGAGSQPGLRGGPAGSCAEETRQVGKHETKEININKKNSRAEILVRTLVHATATRPVDTTSGASCPTAADGEHYAYPHFANKEQWTTAWTKSAPPPQALRSVLSARGCQ